MHPILAIAILFLVFFVLPEIKARKQWYQPVHTIPSWALTRMPTDNYQTRLTALKVMPSLNRRGTDFTALLDDLLNMVRTPGRMVFA